MAVVSYSSILVYLRKKSSSDKHTMGACRWEFKENHKEWLESAMPDLGADIAARAQAAIESNGELVSLVQQIRNEARFAINDLLKVSLWLVVSEECMG